MDGEKESKAVVKDVERKVVRRVVEECPRL
jgi:hypothetical protein